MSLILAATLFMPLVGALTVALLPRVDAQQCRHVGFMFALLTFLLSLAILAVFDPAEQQMQLQLVVPWVTSLGINFHIGIDGISLWLVLLTTFITPVVLLGAYRSITDKVKEFVVAMLVLEVGMLGAFVALDLFLFYVFWELMLLPMYLIIGIWGHGDKIKAAIKFVIYTMVGSLLMLVAIIYMYVTHGEATGNYTFNYLIWTQSIWGREAQLWLFLAFGLAFAIKIPLFPLHTWLPDAHTQAPTAGSVILAGVLLKLGTYGFLRFALPLFPWASTTLAPALTVLALIGIVYGAAVAFAQHDAKRLIAYSSVSHLGFVMLGMLSMNTLGVTGSIYQMISHGISTGGLFYGIGVLYDRRHTHELNQFGGLWKQMPRFAAIYLIILLASAGLPGLNGFIGEFLILIGAFTADGEALRLGLPQLLNLHWGDRAIGSAVIAVVATTGVVLGAIYLLHLFQKLMFGPITVPRNRTLSDLSPRELATFVPLIALVFLMGVYPQPFLKRMEPAVKLMIAEYKAKYDASKQYEGSRPAVLHAMRYRWNRQSAGSPQVKRRPPRDNSVHRRRRGVIGAPRPADLDVLRAVTRAREKAR